MGLDIYIGVNNQKELFSTDYYDVKNNYINKHRLSRTFCNFMSRQYVTSGLPELDQIGQITGIDVTPLYDMDKYQNEFEQEMEMEMLFAENDREELAEQIQTNNEHLNNNIELVLETINALISSLSKIDDLNKKLDHGGYDTLTYDFYFVDFNKPTVESYVRNNFGQDLHNIKTFLVFAKERGTTTVWFSYD